MSTLKNQHDNPPAFTNRLVHEKSPYLLQHAHNPVEWYPWGEEAFTRARAENKPLFLSVGYSACHWCHVMERESFENEQIAALLNAHFISVKVDREERPDVDEIYMTAVQMMTRHGGWPMSVFLTPDGRPFYGGTYFPPNSVQGRIGFGSLLTQLAEAWRDRHAEVMEVAATITEDLQKATQQRPLSTGGTPFDPAALLQSAVAQLSATFDKQNGGFGGAPKFPPHHSLRLLCEAARRGDDTAPYLLTVTLDNMALGGIYDHVGGGFHRYSTDAVWLLPHFEKMLYDNALLARVYADANALTGNNSYARIARETCDWVLREMRDPEGGFHAALDADSEGEEGKYYVWTREEVTALLGNERGKEFAALYNILPDGNFHDEATGRPAGTNIPHLAVGASASVSLPEDLDADTLQARIELLDARGKRVKPGKDDKVITAWNGLMIGALAFTGKTLGEPRYIAASREAAEFCLSALRAQDGTLLRRYARGEAGIAAFLDDYAFLADGLLDLFDATGETRWADDARSLATILLERFWDKEDQGFFYASESQESLIARTKDLFDGALPSANGVATRVLVRLGALAGGALYTERALALLTSYQGILERAPHGTQTLITTAQDIVPDPAPVAPAHILLAPEEEYIVAVPGQKFTATFTLHIAPGFHLNSHSPELSYLLPTLGTIAFHLPARVGPLHYPEGRVIRTGGENRTVYEGIIRLAAPVEVAENAAPGRYHISLSLSYQVCSETECLPPEEQSATVTIEIPEPLRTSA